jgi:hypothetical protein
MSIWCGSREKGRGSRGGINGEIDGEVWASCDKREDLMKVT